LPGIMVFIYALYTVYLNRIRSVPRKAIHVLVLINIVFCLVLLSLEIGFGG